MCIRDSDKAAQILGEEMEHAVDFAVPLTADVTRGHTWLEAH